MFESYRKSLASLAILLLVLPVLAYSQSTNSGKIAGTVKDANGPLTGVNVFLEGTTFGGATDAEGFYVIENVDPGKYVLKVEYIGYKSISKDVEVKAGNHVGKLHNANRYAWFKRCRRNRCCQSGVKN